MLALGFSLGLLQGHDEHILSFKENIGLIEWLGLGSQVIWHYILQQLMIDFSWTYETEWKKENQQNIGQRDCK